MLECVICLEEYEPNGFTSFECGHKTCTHCFSQIDSNKIKCPLCKSDIQIYDWTCLDKVLDDSNYTTEKQYTCKIRKLPASFMKLKYRCSICNFKTKKTNRAPCGWKNCSSHQIE